MTVFYVAVVGGASGLDHLTEQARIDWYYLVAIVAGFGIQVALLTELHRRRAAHRVEHVASGAGAGASTVGMVACCAHHLADLAVIAGVSGAAAFLIDYRVELMLAGIAVNALGVTFAATRLWHEIHPAPTRGTLWPAS